jgi:hypothetical protein
LPVDLVVAAVGTRMPGWIADGWQEYARRMPPHLNLELIEVPVAGKAGAGRESAMEAERLLGRCRIMHMRVAWRSVHVHGRPKSCRSASITGSSTGARSGFSSAAPTAWIAACSTPAASNGPGSGHAPAHAGARDRRRTALPRLDDSERASLSSGWMR